MLLVKTQAHIINIHHVQHVDRHCLLHHPLISHLLHTRTRPDSRGWSSGQREMYSLPCYPALKRFFRGQKKLEVCRPLHGGN